MIPCCTNRDETCALRNRSGFTLVELLVTVTCLAVVVTGLCDVFIANQKAWDRQTAVNTALTATDQALSALGSYASNGMDTRIYSRHSYGDTLVVVLPANMAYGAYVPTHDGGWGHSTSLAYDTGQAIVFYLSDSTGNYNRDGNILWVGTLPPWESPNSWNVNPDAEWSLYPGTTQGRIAPIESMSFSTAGIQRYENVYINVVASYKAGAGTASLSRTRSICLRSQLY